MEYQSLFDNNKKWVRKKLEKNIDYFKKFEQGQHPKFLFIGCSDSRIAVNKITGTSEGDMFVHRNIANVVVHTDMNLMSVLQYAVEVLKVEHVIVCGHYGCGGVKAALDLHHYGIIDKWLRNIKDVYRLHLDELDAIEDKDLKLRRLVELNVKEQVFKLSCTSIVQRALLNNQKVEVHGWVYDIANGIIKDLEIDVKRDFKEFRLYDYNDDSLLSK